MVRIIWYISVIRLVVTRNSAGNRINYTYHSNTVIHYSFVVPGRNIQYLTVICNITNSTFHTTTYKTQAHLLTTASVVEMYVK